MRKAARRRAGPRPFRQGIPTCEGGSEFNPAARMRLFRARNGRVPPRVSPNEKRRRSRAATANPQRILKGTAVPLSRAPRLGSRGDFLAYFFRRRKK